jgi:hypothetical protein
MSTVIKPADAGMDTKEAAVMMTVASAICVFVFMVRPSTRNV